METYIRDNESIISAPRLLAGHSYCCVADCFLRLFPPSVSLPHPRHRNLRQPPFSSLLLRMPLYALRDQHQKQAFEEARSPSADALKATLVDDEPIQMDDMCRRLFCVPHV